LQARPIIAEAFSLSYFTYLFKTKYAFSQKNLFKFAIALKGKNQGAAKAKVWDIQ
jgi:hypothetical protein